MVLTLYTHPLASYWHKGLIALYELPLTEFEPGTRWLITVTPPDAADNSAWENFSRQGLAAAYSPAEPEYALSMVKEPLV